MPKKKNIKKPMKHFDIAEINRGQSSKILRGLVSDDDIKFTNKNGKPTMIDISNEKFERLLENGINMNEY